MGTLTITEILKLLKALKDAKRIKKRKNRKRRKKFIANDNIKSTSAQMVGNTITGEHLRAIKDNNDLKMKLLSTEINDNTQAEISDLNNTITELKNKTAFYLYNHENKLNKLNDLANIYNQSLSRNNFYNPNDNINVPYDSNIDDAFHIEANLPTNNNVVEEKETGQQDIRKFFTASEKTKPSNLTQNNSIFEDVNEDEVEDESDQLKDKESIKSYGSAENYGFIPSDNEEEQKDDAKDEIVEEEEQEDDAEIDTGLKEEEEINDLILKYLNKPEYKNQFEKFYVIDDKTKDYVKNAKNKPMKKNQSKTPDNVNDQTEKLELYKILKYMGESNPSATKKVTI